MHKTSKEKDRENPKKQNVSSLTNFPVYYHSVRLKIVMTHSFCLLNTSEQIHSYQIDHSIRKCCILKFGAQKKLVVSIACTYKIQCSKTERNQKISQFDQTTEHNQLRSKGSSAQWDPSSWLCQINYLFLFRQ